MQVDQRIFEHDGCQVEFDFTRPETFSDQV
jgi:hypothetical protein